MDKLEGKFLARKNGEDTWGRSEDYTSAEPGGDPGGTQRPSEAPDGGGSEGHGGIYVPDVDNRFRVVPAPESKGFSHKKMKLHSSSSTWTSCARSWSWLWWEATPVR
jgi:hypothetical protein